MISSLDFFQFTIHKRDSAKSTTQKHDSEISTESCFCLAGILNWSENVKKHCYFVKCFIQPNYQIFKMLLVARRGRKKPNQIVGVAHMAKAWCVVRKAARVGVWQRDLFTSKNGATHFAVLNTDCMLCEDYNGWHQFQMPWSRVAEPEPAGAKTFGRSRNKVSAPAPGSGSGWDKVRKVI
jgi:hypothetical protein